MGEGDWQCNIIARREDTKWKQRKLKLSVTVDLQMDRFDLTQ